MDKQKKQLIIVGVLVLVLIVSIFSGKKKKPAKTDELKVEPQSGIVVPKPPLAAGPVAPVRPEEKKMNAQLERAKSAWGRDPFSEPSDKGLQMGQLQLKGISFDKIKGGYAFINNEIVKKGDTIGEYEVAEIDKNRVTLKKGNQSFYLVFPGQE